MAKSFIYHLLMIYRQVNYTYIHIYTLKSINIIKTNKNIKFKLGLAPINFNNFLKLDR